jgi:DNA replication and repair protein RecF
MTRYRQHYLEQLQTRLLLVAADLAPALGATSIEFQSGWRSSELSLADALLVSRDRDRGLGYTTIGPHRADWRIDYASHPHRESLSRGQAKLSALSVLLAQAEDYAQRRGDWPIVALDDLSSELDRNHQRRVLQRLLQSGTQVFVTGTESPSTLAELKVASTLFHVEQGAIQPR